MTFFRGGDYKLYKSADPFFAQYFFCLYNNVFSGKQFDYPIYYDLEDPRQFNKGSAFCSGIVDLFCKALEDSQYFSGLYMSRSPLETYISEEVAKRYALWIAEYASQCHYDGDFGIWQYSGSGSCAGITGTVDLDYGYIDYPSIIKNHKF